MNSIEKLTKLQQQAEGPPPADVDFAELAIRTAALGSRHLFGYLPDDPAELDRWIEQGACWLLELRSDDAPAFALATHAGQVQTIGADALTLAIGVPNGSDPEIEHVDDDAGAGA